MTQGSAPRHHSTPLWRKSSYSGDTGGNCVEVADLWRKSTYSGDTGGECVEIADLSPRVGVRDSKRPEGGHLCFPPAEWSAFLTQVRR